MRKVTIINNKTQSQKVIQDSEATTLGELKREMREREESPEILKQIYTEVQQSAYEIIEKKKATYYGIGMGLSKIVKTILNNGKEILTVSTKLEGEYGHDGIFIGVPAIINSDGVQELLNLPLTKDEQAKFDHSCDVLLEMKDEIDRIIM